LLVIQIFRMPVTLSLTRVIQNCPSITHQNYLQIILRVKRHIYILHSQYANINDAVSTNTDPYYSKALPSKIENEKL
jgi:hypothetical protein